MLYTPDGRWRWDELVPSPNGNKRVFAEGARSATVFDIPERDSGSARGEVMSAGVVAALERRKAELSGRTISTQEAAELRERLASELLPPSLLGWMISYPLVETEFYLEEDEDASELGVDMQWLTPEQMISETLEAYPGILAAPARYLPC